MNPLKVLTISSVSIWLGAMAFFSIFVAPAAFSVLDWESAMLGLTFYAILVLEPQMQSTRLALRSAGIAPGSGVPEAQAFARLHRISVILNGVTLLAGLALIGLEAVRELKPR